MGLSLMTPSCSRHDRDTKPSRDSELLSHIRGTWDLYSRGHNDSKRMVVLSGEVVYGLNGEYATRCEWLYSNIPTVDVLQGRYEITNGFLRETITNMSRMPAGDSPPSAIFESIIVHIDDRQLILSNESGIHSFDRKR